MAFHETRFPENISYGSRGGPGFRTDIVVGDSGAEQRIARWASAKRQYDVSWGIKSKADIAELQRFYLARQGAAAGFRYKDWSDYTSAADGQSPPTATDQFIGTGDGITTRFQLRKLYTSGATTRTRPITKPVAGSVRVAFGASEQSGNWTVDPTSGLLAFSSAPAAGTNIYAGYEFDVPVRFGEEADRLLAVSLDAYDSHSVSSIPLVEISDGLLVDEDYLYGGALEIGIAAAYTLGLGLGRVQVISATAGGLSVSLPDKTDLPPGGPYVYLINGGANSFSVDDAGDTLVTLGAGQGVCLVLSVTAAGTKVWYAI